MPVFQQKWHLFNTRYVIRFITWNLVFVLYLYQRLFRVLNLITSQFKLVFYEIYKVGWAWSIVSYTHQVLGSDPVTRVPVFIVFEPRFSNLFSLPPRFQIKNDSAPLENLLSLSEETVRCSDKFRYFM